MTFGHAVRAHWGIEHRVHGVRDFAFRENASRVRKDHGATSFAVRRHIAINLRRHEASRTGSIKAERLRAGWDDTYLRAVPGCFSHEQGSEYVPRILCAVALGGVEHTARPTRPSDAHTHHHPATGARYILNQRRR